MSGHVDFYHLLDTSDYQETSFLGELMDKRWTEISPFPQDHDLYEYIPHLEIIDCITNYRSSRSSPASSEFSSCQTDYVTSSSSPAYQELAPINSFFPSNPMDGCYKSELYYEDSCMKGARTRGPVRSRKLKANKTCAVCGDVAKGYNFDVISCEACKAFFRRNAPIGIETIKCHCGNSNVDVPNRRFCRHCRLKKCFSVGMKKEYILSDEEKVKRNESIKRNRGKRQARLNVSTTLTPELDRTLTSEDKECLRDLTKVYLDSLCLPEKLPTDSVSDMRVTIFDSSIRRIVYMAEEHLKVIQAEDQPKLLKSVMMELITLLSVLSCYRTHEQFLDVPSEPVHGADLLRQSLKSSADSASAETSLVKFITSLVVELKADQSMVLLLFYIALFSPDQLDIAEDRKIIEDQQMKFANLLQRYLIDTLTFDVARIRFPSLLMRLTELRSLTEEHSEIITVYAKKSGNLTPLVQKVLYPLFNRFGHNEPSVGL